MDITVEKQSNGALLLSAIHNGVYCKKVYYFFGIRAARVDFKQYLRGL